ncbi:metallophosphoesterase [Qiania dongpingensis]|uniref:Metallophosphoesterase n=1 Tax=Qiania dongpingensis TaxID=2763669 RepID=A0A7G9G5S5_9FIRM|nr:metallophosphoesterase [Qiania dongpingensis]QNM06157.1 metallophosphoesterase [Qiania dongpingensis]
MAWIITGIVLLLLFLLLFVCSQYERKHVAVREYEVESPDIGEAFDGYTMAVMADLHDEGAGRRNNRMMAAIRRVHPDAVMVAGDMVMARKGRCRYEETIRLMKRLAFRYPVYYGLGNHEDRMGREPEVYGDAYTDWYEGMMRAGVTVLDNISVTLRDGKDAITITGLNMDKSYYHKFHLKPMEDGYLDKTLGFARGDEYHILLAHSPSYFEEYARWGADLTFSGHYHGGTIRFPGIGGLISPNLELFPKYSRGKYQKGKKTMIVSGGLGTHSVNIRLGNMSELLVVRLKRVS